jgi:para-aminobenzoate synthetase/4-amino-4-deoxychorismate lyase
MPQARFDDLTGSSPSFRLTQPAGILEARRIDEVAEVISGAESSAARGLWVAGFVCYEAAPGLDPSLVVKEPSRDLPLAWFAMFEGREETTLPEPKDEPAPPGLWAPSVKRLDYERAVGSIREAIAAGETYQVNHTFRLRATIRGDDRGLYRDLCYAQRGGSGAYLDAGRFKILSASPELFFRIDDGSITTRPMKGTAPRGRWPEEDERVRADLLASAKERAENAMIVDLLRNDLARIAQTGTVTWDDVFSAERYETVWQLTTTVLASLPASTPLVDVFRALFPSGSVTGAPKVRTMELIANLEDSPRGVYCGAVGYISPSGSSGAKASFNVPIRTVVLDTDTGLAEYGVGGGITFDSSASGEYEETVTKARVLTVRRPPFQLFETMRYEPATGVRNRERHLLRLKASADHFGFDPTQVDAELDRAIEHLPPRPLRIRLLLSRNGRSVVEVSPLPNVQEEPVRLEIDTEPVDPSDVFLFHKTTRRRVYTDAKDRHPDADDVLLTNDRGEITESTIANVAVRFDDGWLTPALDCGLLPGIGRAIEIEEGRVKEARIAIEDLRSAGQIALISSVRGWRTAELLG